MSKAEKDRIHELCTLIELEQDREKFLSLVEELNRLLETKEARLQDKRHDKPKNT